jgi:hypothetical protein
MPRSVKYRENTLAFVYGIFAALSAGTAAAVLFTARFQVMDLSILQMVGVGLCALLVIFFLFRAFQQAFWAGLGGFTVVAIGILALAGVLFLPEMLNGSRPESVAAGEPALTPTTGAETLAATEAEPVESPAPASCMSWSDVSPDMVDQEICVYGDVVRAYSSEGVFFMLFTNEPGHFFLLAYNWGDAGLAGSCVQTRGVVKRLGLSPVMVVTQKADIGPCD